MSAPRIPCCVPFCTGSRGDRKNDPIRLGMEWICSKHWRLVSPKTKRLRSAARRRFKAQPDVARRADWRIWSRCKREAIERAMGVS
ncbi:hypothetical protein BMIN10S_03063 [Bosea minatitlanensis]